MDLLRRSEALIGIGRLSPYLLLLAGGSSGSPVRAKIWSTVALRGGSRRLCRSVSGTIGSTRQDGFAPWLSQPRRPQGGQLALGAGQVSVVPVGAPSG